MDWSCAYRQGPQHHTIEPTFSLERMCRPVSLLSVAGDLLIVSVACAGGFVLHAVGDLPLADLILLPLCPILAVMYPQRLRRVHCGTLCWPLVLWLVGQIATDLYRHTQFNDWARADARILVWGLDLVCLFVIVGGNVRRHVLFLMGFALGLLIEVHLQPTEYTDSWKFGYSVPATTATVLVASYLHSRARHIWGFALLLVLAGVHLALGYRAQVLILFMTIALLLPQTKNFKSPSPLFAGRSGPMLVGTMGLSAAAFAAAIVLVSAQQGLLGVDARDKNAAQADSTWGLLIGGRPEILISSIAVRDSPLLGHGAWARDQKYAEIYRDLKVDYGLPSGRRDDADDLIPTHSHLMAAWVEAGICGALFWGYLLYLLARGTLRAATVPSLLAPTYLYALLSLGWAILFSPPGGVVILPEAFAVVILVDVLENRSSSQPPAVSPT